MSETVDKSLLAYWDTVASAAVRSEEGLMSRAIHHGNPFRVVDAVTGCRSGTYQPEESITPRRVKWK